LMFAVLDRLLTQHWIDCMQFFLYNIVIYAATVQLA